MKFIKDLDYKQIASELEGGLQIYIHKKVGNVIPVLPVDSLDDLIMEVGEEAAEGEWGYCLTHKNEYYIIEDMDSTKAFKVMRNFVLNLKEGKDQDELEEIIFGSKPFRNFRNYIHNNWDLREAWFKYKAQEYQEYVQSEIEWIIEKEEDE